MREGSPLGCKPHGGQHVRRLRGPNSGETVHYGAGPVVDFTGGIGPPELAASQLMQPGTPPVYQPNVGQHARSWN